MALRQHAEPLLMAILMVLTPMPRASGAEEQTQQTRPRDAAEAVREGDVQQWLQYYQRERGLPEPETRSKPHECEGACDCPRPAAADVTEPRLEER